DCGRRNPTQQPPPPGRLLRVWRSAGRRRPGATRRQPRRHAPPRRHEHAATAQRGTTVPRHGASSPLRRSSSLIRGSSSGAAALQIPRLREGTLLSTLKDALGNADEDHTMLRLRRGTTAPPPIVAPPVHTRVTVLVDGARYGGRVDDIVDGALVIAAPDA